MASIKKSILLYGYDSNLSLGVLFCLNPLNYNLYLLTGNKKNAAKYSRYLKKIYYTEADDQVQTIIKITQQHHIDLIMAIDELETRYIKANQAELSKHAVCSWMTAIEMFDIGINKKRLAEFLTKNEVPCPSFTVVENAGQLEAVTHQLKYPVLVKPERASYGRMIQRCENPEELKTYYFNSAGDHNKYIIQPFIIGSDITCNVICKNGEVICHTIQESPIKTGTDFSSNDALTFHDDEEVIKVIRKMMKLLNWNGVACVDMRRDQRDQRVYVLEINGRFWASVVASYYRAGLNFPIIMVKLALGEPLTIPKQKPGQQLSLAQVKRAILSGKSGSITDTKYICYLKDPIARAFQMLGS